MSNLLCVQARGNVSSQIECEHRVNFAQTLFALAALPLICADLRTEVAPRLRGLLFAPR
jgi:hypothetical protein